MPSMKKTLTNEVGDDEGDDIDYEGNDRDDR